MVKNKWPYIFIFLLIVLLVWDNRDYFWRKEIEILLPNQLPRTESNIPIPVENIWRRYEGKNFSFEYPNSWADVVETVVSPSDIQVELSGNLIIEDNIYSGKYLETTKSYADFVRETVTSSMQTQPYQLGDWFGIRYFTHDGSWKNVMNIMLTDPRNAQHIVIITCFSQEDEVVTIDVYDPVLATFKFK